MMDIALIIRNYNALGGGAERWTDQYAKVLLARGHRVHVLARSFAHAPDPIQCIGVECGKDKLAFAQAVEKKLTSCRFDLVHDMGESWSGDLFMPHHGTRRGGFLHNGLMLPAPWRNLRQPLWNLLPRYRAFDQLERQQYHPNRPTTFVALSQFVARHMKEYYQVSQNKIRVVYNGVDIKKFMPAPNDKYRRQLRRSLLGFTSKNKKRRQPIFLIVAHNFRLKGVGPAIKALARLHQSGQPATLILAGQEKSSRYQFLAKKLNVLDHVRFVGHQPDPRPWYRLADVYLQPTFYDPCSLVTLESLASGVPVISTPYNGASELITPGVQGDLLDHPQDDFQLAQLMKKWCDADRVAASRLQARALAELHSFDRNVSQLLEIQTTQLRQAA